MQTLQPPSSDEDLLFAGEEPGCFFQGASPELSVPWKILVVDDEEDVHGLTRMILAGFSLDSRPVQILNAFSAREARTLLEAHSDIALILLDVVMEEENSGLLLVRHIREVLNNHSVRIILRTGQPGQAPESRIIVDYDINDYKEKAELTSQKLTTAMISGLRCYKMIREIAGLNAELEDRVKARTEDLYQTNLRLQETLRQLEEDENAGRRIQFRLLPAPAKVIGGIHFSHILRPSLYLSGDFVDYFPVGNVETAFYIADVSGHGVASAFVTVLLKSFITTHLTNAVHHHDETIRRPAELLQQLNTNLLEEDLGKHLTFFYGILEESTGRLRYSSGGHFPCPILISGNGEVKLLEEIGPAVGLFDTSTYREETCLLPSPFHLTLSSDGILDLLPPTGLREKFALLQEACRTTPSCAEELLSRLKLKGSTEGLPDDVTLLVIHPVSGRL